MPLISECPWRIHLSVVPAPPKSVLADAIAKWARREIKSYSTTKMDQINLIVDFSLPFHIDTALGFTTDRIASLHHNIAPAV